jgi:tyrosyl-tRNA synthetase
MTLPLLEGTDARVENGRIVGAKMSKSKDNYIGITEEPIAMFRKSMQIDDAVIWRYFELLSSRSADDIAALKSEVIAGRSPLEIKALFATEIIGRYHSADAAIAAQAEFQSTYMPGGAGIPDNVPEVPLTTDGETLWIAKALSLAGLVKTTSEGKRLVEQGGVEIDGERIKDPQFQLAQGARYLIRAGSKHRRFANVIIKRTT